MKALVTGGCGFIGSALVRNLVAAGHDVLNVDKLTYAGDPRTLLEIDGAPNYSFAKMDIIDQQGMLEVLADFAPDVVFHLAAESHVDRSIEEPNVFIDTNIHGTYALLQGTLEFWKNLDSDARARFRFIHISTDEVFGGLDKAGLFNDESAYRPSSPYAASKASADHLVRAWQITYGLPTIVSTCSNNYGPFQNREKLIPTIIRKALLDQPIPIYGNGENVRDWLYVEDHVRALLLVYARGTVGSNYVIGGQGEMSNLDLARMICAELDRRRPLSNDRSYAEQIEFVTDRPGHDFRYGIDPRKAERDIGWKPRESLAGGLSKTIDWYLGQSEWTFGPAHASGRLGQNVTRK